VLEVRFQTEVGLDEVRSNVAAYLASELLSWQIVLCEETLMTTAELKEIVEQKMNDPWILGRLACNLRDNDLVEQRHHDKRNLIVYWRETIEFWRCTIFLDEEEDLCLAQIDLCNDSTIRVEVFEPCSVTISPQDGLLCLTRYRPR
jgi:hypothetical protein